MDPYVKISISNQVKTTDIKTKGGVDTHFDEHFVFHINSCYKAEGRKMEVAAMDKGLITGDKVIGYALLDLESIIIRDEQIHDIKVRLSLDNNEVGWVTLREHFE